MVKERQFRVIICRNGHFLYSGTGKPERKYCKDCGSDYLRECDHCGASIPDSFTSKVFPSSGKPISFLGKPKHCIECGQPFPWLEAKNQSMEHIWSLLHPSVVATAKDRFESGHLADSVEAALKELNLKVKELHLSASGEEKDGVALMRKAFKLDTPSIQLDDLSTVTGKNIQQGYADLFAGAMAGIRNPKAHKNLIIDETRAIHHLFLASLLFSKLDEHQERTL